MSAREKMVVNLEWIEYYCVHQPDFEKAKWLYEKDKGLQAFLQSDGPLPIPINTRILAVYTYFVLGEEEKGRMLLEKAKNQLKDSASTGLKKMEMDYISFLETKM